MKFILLSFILITLKILNAHQYSINYHSQSANYREIMYDQLISKYCNGNDEILISLSDYSTNNNYFGTLSNLFNKDPITLINSIKNQDMSTMVKQILNLSSGLFIYIGPFLLGLLLVLTIWTCLLCMICKNHKKAYSKCELWWPSIVLILLILTGSVIGIIAISKSDSIPSAINNVQCGILLIYKNVLTGNMKSNNKFLGTNNLIQNIANITSNLSTTINISTNKIGNLVNQIQSYLINAMNHTSYLGTGNKPNISYQLIYNSPTPFSSKVVSSFGSMLGNPTIGSSLSGNIYGILCQAYEQIGTTIIPFISEIQNQTDSLIKQINPILSEVNNTNNQIINSQTQVLSVFNQIDPYKVNIQSGYLIVSIIITSLFLLFLFSFLLYIFTRKSLFRYIIYTTCILTQLLAIITFLICISVSIAMPVLYLGCNLANGALNSSQELNNITTQFQINQNITSFLDICVLGNGDILDNYVNTTDIINQIHQATQNITQSVETSQYDTGSIQEAWVNLTSQINLYSLGQINDIIQDKNILDWFNALAYGILYTQVCSQDTNFTSDSLVPSINIQSTQYIKCYKQQAIGCTTIDQCSQGCIGLNQVMSEQDNITNFIIHIQERYSGECGIQISNDLAILYNNWYLPRVNNKTGISSIYNRLIETGNSLDNDIQQILETANIAQENINNVANQIIDQINLQIDPNIGFVAESNCLPIGKSIVNLKDSVCVLSFNKFYQNLIMFGILSFIFLCSNCCISLAVRRLKNNENNIDEYVEMISENNQNNAINVE